MELALRITAIAAIVIAGIGAFVLTKPVIIAGIGVFLLTKPLIIAGGVTYLATRALIDNSTVSKNEIKIAGKIESKVGYMNELNGCVNNLSDLSIGRFVPKNAQENFEYFKHLYKVQSENESKPLFDNDIDASYDIISGNMIDGYVSNLSYLSINYYVKNRNDAQENLNYYSVLYEFQTANEDKPLFENNLDVSYDIIDKIIKKYQRELGSLG